IDPGDEVIVLEPFYENYGPDAILSQATPVFLTLEAPAYRLDRDRLAALITPRTRAIVLNSPNNPMGRVFDREELQGVADLCIEHDLLALTDEIYEHFIYGGAEFVSLPVAAPEAAGRCVVVNSVAKTYAMTGWRVGWMIGPPEVAAAVARLQSHSISNVANVSQFAAIAALEGPMDPVDAMRTAFDRRRRTMFDMLRTLPGVEVNEPHGALYAFPRVDVARALPGRPAASSHEFAEILLETAEIAVVPGEAFGSPGSVRLSYALDDADLVAGLERWRDLARA
ncbi:MAG TPA: aspartate aminotransferase, partial [Actinobacteria bacterium]|nr:aspartate aminotransferase [Actinomycetota bacterium]